MSAQLALGPGMQAITHRHEHRSLKAGKEGIHKGLMKSILSLQAANGPVRSHGAGVTCGCEMPRMGVEN